MLTTSAEIHDLATALAAAQLVMDNAIKESTNPAFRSRYADLAAVRAAVNLPLAQAGIACVQAPATQFTAEGVTVCVETRLVHKSGQWMACTVTAAPKDPSPQAIGSTITYLRRYGLLAIAGIAPEDDDGNAGSGRQHQAPPPAAVERWNDDQRTKFCSALAELGLSYENVARFTASSGHPKPENMSADERRELYRYLKGAEGMAAFQAWMGGGNAASAK